MIHSWLRPHLAIASAFEYSPFRVMAALPALLILGGLSGCDRGAERPLAAVTPVVRDSAGVTIISVPPAAQVPQRVSVDERPFLTLGGLDDSGQTELDLRTPWLSAVALEGGEIAVNETSGIKLFSSRGRFQSTVGKAGLGPGEFAQVREVCPLSGNSFMAIDFPSQKRTVVSPTGQIERVVRTDGVIPVGACNRTGHVLVRVPSQALNEAGSRSSSAYRILSLDDEWLSGRVEVPRALEGGPISFEQSFLLVGNRIVVAEPQSGAIHIYSREGTLVSQIRLGVSPRPVSDAQWDSLVLWTYPARYNPPELRRRLIERARAFRPLHYPAFGRVWADSAETLWIQDYENPVRFTVLTLSGELLGSIEFPSGRLTRVATNHVVVRDFDRDGAAILRFHRIEYE